MGDTAGNPVEGVVVSDGFQCVATDAGGVYEMKRNAAAEYVYYSVPAEFKIRTGHDGYPDFYVRLDTSQQKIRQDFTLDPQSLISSIRHVSEQIRLRIGYDLLQDSNISSMVAVITRFGQAFLQGIFSFGVNIVMLLFVLYFMLIGGTRMENYCRAMLPFNATVARNVTNEIYMIVRSNAIGIPLIAVVQGSIAYAGYLVCGVPSALFWGVVTCFATILPVVGTALVWVPLAAYLAVAGSGGAAVGLMAYGVLVVTQSDNVIRFILQKRMADTHPLVTILGVLIGLPLFGFMGVIFGPLLLAMFVFFVHIFKRKYLDGAETARLFVPDR